MNPSFLTPKGVRMTSKQSRDLRYVDDINRQLVTSKLHRQNRKGDPPLCSVFTLITHKTFMADQTLWPVGYHLCYTSVELRFCIFF